MAERSGLGCRRLRRTSLPRELGCGAKGRLALWVADHALMPFYGSDDGWRSGRRRAHGGVSCELVLLRGGSRAARDGDMTTGCGGDVWAEYWRRAA
jgi:hypothetical protein